MIVGLVRHVGHDEDPGFGLIADISASIAVIVSDGVERAGKGRKG